MLSHARLEVSATIYPRAGVAIWVEMGEDEGVTVVAAIIVEDVTDVDGLLAIRQVIFSMGCSVERAQLCTFGIILSIASREDTGKSLAIGVPRVLTAMDNCQGVNEKL